MSIIASASSSMAPSQQSMITKLLTKISSYTGIELMTERNQWQPPISVSTIPSNNAASSERNQLTMKFIHQCQSEYNGDILMAQQTLDMLQSRVPSSATMAKIDIKKLELNDLYLVQAELRQQMVVEEANKKHELRTSLNKQ